MEAAALEVLRRFETDLDPRRPEAGAPRARVLGYGEMSTVLAVEAPGLDAFALKRMAIFRTEAEVRDYETLLADYVEVLRGVGLDVPAQFTVRTTSGRTGLPVLYIVQDRLDPGRIGNVVVRNLDAAAAGELVRRILTTAVGVLRPGRAGDRAIGLDAQISNWEVGDEGLRYLDTGTPLLRDGGAERIDPELFLRLCPAGLRWLLRRFFLQEILDRFYDARATVVDHLGNLVKEGRADLVPRLAGIGTEVLREGWDADVEPVTADEVHAFYREDKRIWRLFLALRRTERFVSTRLWRRPYDVVLPGRIRR